MKLDNMGLSLSNRLFSQNGNHQYALGFRRLSIPAAAIGCFTAIFLSMGVMAGEVHAQASGGPAPTSTATTSAYKIAVDDVVDISVVDHAISQTYQIPADGVIEPPAGGDINVLGMTVSDLRAHLTKAFAKRFYKPQVIVNVHPSQQTINIVGVTRGGKLALKSGERILDALAASGGLPIDRPESYKGTLFRASSAQAVPIDIQKLFNSDPSQNLELASGDTLYIEEKDAAETTVQVLGEVMKPGPILVPRDHSIITVMQAVGGPSLAAALSHVILDHAGQQTTLDLRNYRMTGFDPAAKIVAGDKLIVPENKNEYYIFGAGERTGTQIYPDDQKLTVYTAMLKAGGTSEGVDLTKIKLIHPLGNGTTKTTMIDVSKMVKAGDFSADQPVVPGDTVYFPPSRQRKGLGYQEVLGIATGLISVIFTLRSIRGH